MDAEGRAPALRELFDLSVFIVMSAKLCVTEPPMYGPFRLLDVLQRLIALRRGLAQEPDAFLDRMNELVEEKKWCVQWDLDEFVRFLDELVERFTREVAERTG